MEETEYRLEESRSVTIGASGIGSVLGIGPSRPNERWEITNTSVSATARCTFGDYRGSEVNASRQIDFTFTGQGDSSNTVIKLEPQEKISIAFRGSNGTVGTVVFSGSRFVKGRRSY